MAYPGNPELSAQAQERVMTAFRQVITKLQQGQRDEALIALDFVLRLDQDFTPGAALQEQLRSSSQQVDLGRIVSLLQDSSEIDADGLLVEAVDDFNARSFVDAREKVQRVLMDIPGHSEARQLLKQIDDALEKETLIGDLLSRARERIDGGDLQGAAELVMDAQALDPHHPGIHAALGELEQEKPRGEPAPEPGGTDWQDDQDGAFATMAADVGDLEFAFEPAGGAEPGERAPGPPIAPPDTTGPEPDGGGEPSPGVLDDDGYDPWSETAAGELSFGEEDAPPMSPAGEEEPALPAFEQGLGSDVADLFSEESSPSFDVDEPALDGAGDADEVGELLEQGQAAFDRGDDQAAIDAWSRIYLVDPANEEAARRIDAARARIEDTARRLDAKVAEAREALARGDHAEARQLADEVLGERPDHLEAVELVEQLEPAPRRPAEPEEAAAPALPELDESLFEDSPMEEPVAQPGVVLGDEEAGEEEVPARAARSRMGARSLPWRMVAVVAGALVVVLVGVFFGSQFLSSQSGDRDLAAVNRILDQAQDLFSSGRVEEAVHLLQAFRAEDELDQQRIETRLQTYQQALAPPTPTPIPPSVDEAEAQVARGELLSAYETVQRGLEAHPRDAGLEQLRSDLMRAEPQVASLHRAITGKEWDTAASIARDLVERHPSNSEYAAAYRRTLFNAALAELRVYSLTGAEGYLRQLARLEPQDAEVQRILDFIDKYKTRPVDMQLRIFIGSLSPR